MFEGMPKNNSFYGNSRNKASNEDFIGSGRSSFDRLSATGGIQSESDGMDTDSEVAFGTDIARLLRMALSGTSYDIARLVYHMYEDKYRVARLKNKSWYMHDGLKWKPTEIGPYYELSTTVLRMFEQYKDIQIAKDSKDSIIERIDNVMLKLKNVNSKENICKECVYLFYDSEFLEKLDMCPNIICFNNGVLDIGTNDFRAGVPDDMVSLNIDLDFVVPKSGKENLEITKLIEAFQDFRTTTINKRKNRYVFLTRA
jgi:hypothetical protein